MYLNIYNIIQNIALKETFKINNNTLLNGVTLVKHIN